MNLSPPSVESVAIFCYGALQSQCYSGCIILRIANLAFFLWLLLSCLWAACRSWVKGQPLPHLPHPLNLGKKGWPNWSHWSTVGKHLDRISLKRVQIQDLAPLANYSAPRVWHLHSDLTFLSSLRTPAARALHLYHSQGSSPTLACTAELNREIPVTPYGSPCRCASSGLAQLQTEADKM